MSDWPSALIQPGRTVITPTSLCTGIAASALGAAGFGGVTVAWPSANLALFVPFFLELPFRAQQGAWENGGTVAGNIDVGVYDENGSLLTHTGSTAQSGTSAIQIASMSSTLLVPGSYFMAMVASNATAIVRSGGATAPMLRASGVQQMATAIPLPSTATFANPTNSFVPWFSIVGVATA